MLKKQRPAWNEMRLISFFAYFREDHNTAWIHLNATDQLSSIGQLSSTLDFIKSDDFIKCALIKVDNRESVEDAIKRGFELKPDSLRNALKLNSSFV